MSIRLLIPKEHGAYGQLGLPLLAALGLGRPGWAAVLLVMAAWSAFFAHEPAAVLLGKRGRRLQRQQRGRALASGALWGALGAICGALGLVLGGEPVWRASVIPAVLALGAAPVFLRGQEKSLAGELLAAAATACGAPPAQTLWAWTAWSLAFFASTGAVRWVIGRHKRRPVRTELAVVLLATLAAGALSLRSGTVAAAAPYLAAAWILIAAPPSPRHLRRVGWILMASGVLTAALIVLLGRT